MKPTSEQKERQRLARHEAAHFVIHWATGNPAYQVDITSAAQKDGGDWRIMAQTFGDINISAPLEEALILLAGPVADHWGEDAATLLDGKKSWIDNALSSIADGIPLGVDDGDWDGCLRMLALLGVDPLDHQRRQDALRLLINGVRSILRLCQNEWQEAADYLIEHGRIGYDGDHADCGEGAAEFFSRWGGDWEEPPKGISSAVAAIAEKARLLGLKRQEVINYERNAPR